MPAERRRGRNGAGMDAVVSYLSMGGYAAYVWPAVGATVLVLGALLVSSLRDVRRREAQLAAPQDDGRQGRAAGETRHGERHET